MQRTDRTWWQRGLVFGLASLSFACLLGQLYGRWNMQAFGLCVMLPGVLLLAWLAWAGRDPAGPRGWVVHGTIGGVLAAAAYDLYRVPFVLGGAPLFKVFGRFGELLLGATAPRWAVLTLGWGYHFLNGASLGIMLLAAVAPASRGRLFWSAVAWALVVEALLLASPYPKFFGLARTTTFLGLTASAHLVFGVTLGSWCQRRPELRALPKPPDR